MTNRIGRRFWVALAAAGFLACIGYGTSLVASDDQEVINEGNCSGPSDWKARIRTDGPSLLDLEFQGGQVANERWRVRLTYNGDRVFSGIVTSGGAEGEFDVDVEVSNEAGQDTLVGVARNLVTGEVCRGSVTANF
jgi:hypothetical protein